jgi:hypothetical protein
VRMVTLQLAREPETVAAGHHDVDHREVAGLGAEQRERFFGVAGGSGVQAERPDPPRHEVAYGRFIVHDQDGAQRCHGMQNVHLEGQECCHASVGESRGNQGS